MKKFTKCGGHETTSVSWDRPASDITNFHPSCSSFYFLLRMWLWDQLTFVLQRRNTTINSFLLLLSFRMCKEALTGTKSRVRLVTRKCNSFPEPVGYLCVSVCARTNICLLRLFYTVHMIHIRSKMTIAHINNCPTRCNTKQSIYYSTSSLYMFRVSTTPIIRSTQNCNYSLRYWSYFLYSYLPPPWP